MPHSATGKVGRQSAAALVDELEAAVAGRDIGTRAEMLRQVTDLFVTGSGCRRRAARLVRRHHGAARRRDR